MNLSDPTVQMLATSRVLGALAFGRVYVRPRIATKLEPGSRVFCSKYLRQIPCGDSHTSGMARLQGAKKFPYALGRTGLPGFTWSYHQDSTVPENNIQIRT
jgi:hypothetical protein